MCSKSKAGNDWSLSRYGQNPCHAVVEVCSEVPFRLPFILAVGKERQSPMGENGKAGSKDFLEVCVHWFCSCCPGAGACLMTAGSKALAWATMAMPPISLGDFRPFSVGY